MNQTWRFEQQQLLNLLEEKEGNCVLMKMKISAAHQKRQMFPDNHNNAVTTLTVRLTLLLDTITLT